MIPDGLSHLTSRLAACRDLRPQGMRTYPQYTLYETAPHLFLTSYFHGECFLLLVINAIHRPVDGLHSAQPGKGPLARFDITYYCLSSNDVYECTCQSGTSSIQARLPSCSKSYSRRLIIIGITNQIKSGCQWWTTSSSILRLTKKTAILLTSRCKSGSAHHPLQAMGIHGLSPYAVCPPSTTGLFSSCLSS